MTITINSLTVTITMEETVWISFAFCHSYQNKMVVWLLCVLVNEYDNVFALKIIATVKKRGGGYYNLLHYWFTIDLSLNYIP